MIVLLGPDLLFGIALGQLSSARRGVRLFQRGDYFLKGTEWKQFHYLLKHYHRNTTNALSRPQTISTKGDKLVHIIRAKAKEQTHPNISVELWYRTPLDFINGYKWVFNAHWPHYRRLSHILHIKLVSCPIKTRPKDRFPSDQWLPPNMRFMVFGSLAAMMYHSFFSICGGVYYLIEAIRWNRRQNDGTSVEREGVARVLEAERSLSLKVQPCNNTTIRRRQNTFIKLFARASGIASLWRNISTHRDPAMRVSLKIIVPMTVTCIIYVLARGFLYVEDFVSYVFNLLMCM
ncbi:hypothetical protein F5Y16DRAFT_414350 [Xylariaceae sp. FL0255]|nr:hypothetical protein F5Y16DRAFT_414350 [Xylariaceae sp. FL0255]